MADYNECSWERCLAYMKTYKHNTEDGCDEDAQIAELSERVLAKFPNCVFDNR